MESFDKDNLIDQFLIEQQALSEVEKFSELHDNSLISKKGIYKNLMTSQEFEKSSQYSFEVDVDACTACKACVVACHSLNGLNEEESWRDVGFIKSYDNDEESLLPITTACHHCLDPACSNGCPVLAYHKDEKTGIVRHLDDQCIGCQYCILKCPYDVPKYNKKLGIVRKCDMCYERVESKEMPACVQACPNGAISIKTVSPNYITKKTKNSSLTPGAVSSEYTKPTTNFKRKSEFSSNQVPVDNESLKVEHTHFPLVLMLSFTQAGVGVFLYAQIIQLFFPFLFKSSFSLPVILTVGTFFTLLGLTFSFFHLGSPLGAWRCFLGLRKSWLSREIFALSGHVFFVQLLVVNYWFKLFPSNLNSYLLGISVISGIMGVFCSIMVYVDTKRDLWKFHRTAARFFGSSLVCGAVISMFVISLESTQYKPFLLIFLSILFLKLCIEVSSLLPAKSKEWSSEKKSALLQLKNLKKITILRGICFLINFIIISSCIIFFPLSIISFTSYLGIVLFLCIVGEVLERVLYFKSVVAYRMPGNLS